MTNIEENDFKDFTGCKCGCTSFVAVRKYLEFFEFKDNKLHLSYSDNCDNDTQYSISCEECGEYYDDSFQFEFD